jgi:hypothetical protein
MPRGEKTKYTEKQKRQAEHMAEGYMERGVPEEEAKRRAWATVNEMTGAGKKGGSGRGKGINVAPAKKGGKIGGPGAGRLLPHALLTSARPQPRRPLGRAPAAGRPGQPPRPVRRRDLTPGDRP